MPKLLHYQTITSLPHALLLLGGREESKQAIRALLSKIVGKKFVAPDNPDYLERDFSVFGVDDGRQLKAWQSRRPFGDKGKCFVLSAHSFTIEAQNALLKTLEEPQPETHIIIIAPTAGIFLPTVLSRLTTVQISTGEMAEVATLAEDFLLGNIPSRLKLSAKLAERQQKGNKEISSVFLSILFMKVKTMALKNETADWLAGLTAIEQFLANSSAERGSLFKQFLDHIAVALPTH